jgi:hypothetical protein
MFKARQSAAQIHNILISLAESRDLPVTWILSDLQAHFTRDPLMKIWDAKNVLEYLVSRHQTEGLVYNFSTDDDGRLSLVFTEISGGRECYINAGDKTCILYDTTHGTNYYGCKLGLFTSKLKFLVPTFYFILFTIYYSFSLFPFFYCFISFRISGKFGRSDLYSSGFYNRR